MDHEFTLSNREATIVLGILKDIQSSDMINFIGNETRKQMNELVSKMDYNDYCIEHGKTYEQLDADDFMNIYYDRYEF